MNEDTLSPEARALLAAWLKAVPAEMPSPELLADWLAGRLDEVAAASVERALAADAGLRTALLALREGATEIASADEVARARQLLPAAAQGDGRWRYAVAASLLLAAGGLGWMMGSTAAGDAADRAAVTAADVFGDSSGL